MNRDELASENEYADLLDALTAAKKSGNRDKLAEAKTAVFEFRERRRAVARLAVTGEATPKSLKVKAKGN